MLSTAHPWCCLLCHCSLRCSFTSCSIRLYFFCFCFFFLESTAPTDELKLIKIFDCPLHFTVCDCQISVWCCLVRRRRRGKLVYNIKTVYFLLLNYAIFFFSILNWQQLLIHFERMTAERKPICNTFAFYCVLTRNSVKWRSIWI